MRLSHYIFLSLILHLLLIGTLKIRYPEKEIGLPVFDVDIVDKADVFLPPPKKTIPSIKKPSLQTLPPKTIYGEGRGTQGSDISKTPDIQEDLSGLNGYVPADKKGLLPSPPNKPALKPKYFLFDKETIEEFAKKGPPVEKGLTFDTSEFRHRGYLRMLKEKIEGIWKYPPKAARQGISGDLYIRFSIKKDGDIGEVELLRTSGHKDLDEAAIKAVRDAAPYWPLPKDWDEDDFTITGHFIYLPGYYYVM